MAVVGKVISGGFGKILVRQKSGKQIELGDLLVGEAQHEKLILQVYDLLYGSQLSQQSLELVSGINLEEDSKLELMDFNMRNYTLAMLKSVLAVRGGLPKAAKTLPRFFSDVRQLEDSDLAFLSKPTHSLFLGRLRSGSKVLGIEVCVDSNKALAHHILISAQTGKGKSNLAKVMLYKAIGNSKAGFLVLDPHDEYFGRHGLGLKDHPSREVVYYTPSNPPPGHRQLLFSLECIKPEHFEGSLMLSDPQWQALSAYHRKYKDRWIEAILLEKEVSGGFFDATLNVVKRRLRQLLGVNVAEGKLIAKGVFSIAGGSSTVSDICTELEGGKVVVIDTSMFSKSLEVLIGSLISTELFKRYKHHKYSGQLRDKPVVSIVIEEAPRVLGREVLERGGNIFSTIAREGRKFKIGLVAITQLPSLIPRDILANMNTKIILGTEMANERQALISSAAQDLSDDDRTIASLDTGEAIISSSFLKMAVPVKIPQFKEVVKQQNLKSDELNFVGVALE